MRRAMTIGLMTTAALVLASCGSSDRTGAEGSDTAAVAEDAIDPCSLITAQEMTAITSDAVTRADRGGATCHYRSNPDMAVQVTVQASGGAEHMETVRNAAKLLGGMGASVAGQGNAGEDVADILSEDKSAAPPLGDEAIWGMNDTLSVRKGDAFVEVTPPLMHDRANHPGYPIVSKEEKRRIAARVVAKVFAKMP